MTSLLIHPFVPCTNFWTCVWYVHSTPGSPDFLLYLVVLFCPERLLYSSPPLLSSVFSMEPPVAAPDSTFGPKDLVGRGGWTGTDAMVEGWVSSPCSDTSTDSSWTETGWRRRLINVVLNLGPYQPQTLNVGAGSGPLRSSVSAFVDTTPVLLRIVGPLL